jgi:hypothetical protein
LSSTVSVGERPTVLHDRAATTAADRDDEQHHGVLDDYGGPVRVAGGLRRGARGERWGRGFHATRRSYVDSILDSGLLIGGAHHGVMSVVEDSDDHWPNRAYGSHPAFVFLEPHYRENYTWETSDGGTENPVWLEIDLGGLTLNTDFWELREVTQAAVSSVGFWWGRYDPDVEAAPELLRPYANEDGIVTYEALLDDGASAAIEVSRSAALFAPVEASRIKLA